MRHVAVLTACCALFALPAAARSIEGTVHEKGTRRAVPGALVVLRGTSLETTTDEQGAFVLDFDAGGAAGGDAEQPSRMRVTIEVDTPGYALLAQDITLRRDRSTTSVDLYLSPLDAGETRVRERRSRDNVARGSHRIDGNEVSEMPGTYGDPAKAIENFPGMGRVVLSQGSLFVRGANPNESMVLVDDFEIPDLYHYTGSTSVINAPFVESVELVPGAFSARYGRSTGGVISLKTKRLQTDEVHGLAKLDVIDSGAYVGVPLGEKIAVGASARRSYLDVIRNIQKETQGTGDAILLTPTYWDYQLKLDWDTAPGHELVVFAFGSGDRELYESDGLGPLDPYSRTNDSDFHRVSLRYQHNIGSGFTHTFNPVIGYARSELVEQGGLRSKSSETFDAQLRDELTYRTGTSKVVVGVDATARADGFVYGGFLADDGVYDFASADLESVAGGDRVRQDTWRTTGALYVEGNMEPLDGVLVVPGLRAEGYLLDGTPHVMLEPRFTASWQVIPGDWGLLLRTGAGVTSRPPDPDELAAAAAAGVALPPQQALQLQGGFEQHLSDRLSVSATWFAIWRDELNTRAATFPVPQRVGELPVYGQGSGFSQGAELLARIEVPKRYFAWLTYSIVRNERQDGPSPIGVDYAYVSPSDTTHLLGVVGQIPLPWGFRVGARYRFATGMPTEDVAGAAFDADTGRYVAQYGPRAGRRFPPFSVADVRVDWTALFDLWQLDLYADLVNVSTIATGRPIEGTLYNYDFSETLPRYGLPLIPSIGAKATF